jgi:acyl-CoA thioesterase-1
MTHMVPRPVDPRPWAGVVLLAALVLLTGCGGDEDRALPAIERDTPDRSGTIRGGRPPETAASYRIAALGDSLAAGYGLPVDAAFPALLERYLRDEGHAVEVLNAGVSGDTSAGGLSRLDWVLRSRPDLLLVELGANDALRGQPLPAVERNLRSIVTRARDRGVDVLLLGMDIPTNYGVAYTRGFAALYQRIADDLDVALVPGFVREVGLDPNLIQPDGLHPTAEGQRVLARSLVPHVREFLPPPGG